LKVDVKGNTVNLPDFLIVGAARCGTTSLYHYLKQHPQIFMPDVNVPFAPGANGKEPQFFAFSEKPTSFMRPKVQINGNITDSKIIWRFDDYIKLFESAGINQIVGEASTGYLFFYEKSINNIKKYHPHWQDLKIIIILRNPVERAFSFYSLFSMIRQETLKFEEAIDPTVLHKRLASNWSPWYDYIGFGFYYHQVKAYLANFKEVRVFLFEDIKNDACSVMRESFRFLNVSDTFVPDVHIAHNPSQPKRLKVSFFQEPISSKFPILKPLVELIPLSKRQQIVDRMTEKGMKLRKQTANKLKELYKPDILKLQGLLKRDLSRWLQ